MCDLLLVNNETKRSEQITVELLKIKSGHDIVIGRPTIKKHNLATKFPSHFFESTTESPLQLQVDMEAPRSADVGELQAPASSQNVDSPNVNAVHFQREHMSKFIDTTEDPTRFTLDGTHDAPWQGLVEGINTTAPSEIPSQIYRTSEFIAKVIALCMIF